MRFASLRSMKEEGHLVDSHNWEEGSRVGLRTWSDPETQIISSHFFLLEAQLCSVHCFLLFYCRWPSPLVCMPTDQTALGFHHAGLGTLEERESSSLYINSKEGYQLMLLGSHVPTPRLKHYGWWTPSCDILRKIYLVSVSCSGHITPKILVISWVIGVSFVLMFSLSFCFLKQEIPRPLKSLE